MPVHDKCRCTPKDNNDRLDYTKTLCCASDVVATNKYFVNYTYIWVIKMSCETTENNSFRSYFFIILDIFKFFYTTIYIFTYFLSYFSNKTVRTRKSTHQQRNGLVDIIVTYCSPPQISTTTSSSSLCTCPRKHASSVFVKKIY